MNDINLFGIENSIYLKKIKSKFEILNDDICDGYLIDADEKMARQIVDVINAKWKIVGGKKKKIGVVGGDDAFNRRVVETLKVDYLVSPERGWKVDSLKQRDSGINHVVAKIAREKKILVVIDVTEIGKLKSKEKVLRLARLIQNVKVCRKAGCEIRTASLGSQESEVVDGLGRKAFGVSLGMSSKQSAESIKF